MRVPRLILAVGILFLAGTVFSHAVVRSYDKLNLNEKLALEESERRLAAYDQELLSLDHQRSKGNISKDYYETETQQLTLVIREETLYQNAILVKDPELPQRAKDLFENMQHVVIGVPVGIGYGVAYVIGKCPQLLGCLAAIR